jgi:putative alpha-1,2-mannosidase
VLVARRGKLSPAINKAEQVRAFILAYRVVWSLRSYRITPVVAWASYLSRVEVSMMVEAQQECKNTNPNRSRTSNARGT